MIGLILFYLYMIVFGSVVIVLCLREYILWVKKWNDNRTHVLVATGITISVIWSCAAF